MKFLFFFITIIIISYSKIVYSNTINKIYESKFYNIEIKNEVINEAKFREINRIKIISFNDLLDKILIKSEKNRFNRLINLKNKLDYIVKNIIIENEFISQNIYKADIRINFDDIEIVKLLRDKKINYTDLESPNFLILASEENKLFVNGLSINNSFYNFTNNFENNFINIIIPSLSQNDRFILPYEKILKKDLIALNKITSKYNTDFALIINIVKSNHNYNLSLNFFSRNDNSLIEINKLIVPDNTNYYDQIFLYLNEWWKIKNTINNSKINKYSCFVESESIEELYLINSKINSLSQTKSNIIKKIQFQNNQQIITFYGDLKIFIFSLLRNNILITINNFDECVIKLLS